MHKVFVYGSLKRGFGNNVLLADSNLIDTTLTKDRFQMNSLGGFPGVVKSQKGFVSGELYEVNDTTLARLDQLEGNGRFYNREVVDLENGEEAWMYFLMEEYGEVMFLDPETQSYSW